MAHKTDDHLEHSQHVQHHAHNPFDRQVAMTMAIVAAMLACVTMLSHRSHNGTLVLQAEANSLETKANIKHTQASDQWSYYQAKNIRTHEYKSNIKLVTVLAKDATAGSEVEKARDEWAKQVAKYESELPEMQKKATELEHEATHLQEEALEKLQESHGVHHQADRFDLGELGVELALVLCSVAVLTKRREFWILGIIAGAVGAGVAGTAFFTH